jgi:hypothetical protein
MKSRLKPRPTPVLGLAVAASVVLAVAPAVSASPLAVALAPFHAVSVSSAIEATIVVGGPQSVAVEVDSAGDFDIVQ